MKMKKVLKGLALGAVISLAVASGAQAGLKEVNMFGASAQYDFWSAAGPAYLGAQGCAAGDIVSLKKKGQTIAPFDKRDYFIAVCKGDTPAAGQTVGGGIGANHDTVVIRYTTYASGQGVKAVMDDDTDVDECTASGAGYRGMIDTLNAAGTSISTVGCKQVHGGASDVAAETFDFDSHGASEGPCSADWRDEEVRGLTANPEFNNLLPAFKPLVVPFAFFANAQFPFDNISRSQAFLVFTGAVDNWNFFKADLNGDGQITADAYPAGDDLPVRVCMRHASSGTQATLLASIIRREGAIDGYENPFFAPYKYFNKGSTEMVNCIKGCDATGYADFGGAIGIIDADKEVPVATSMTEDGTLSPDGKMKRLSYNGFTAIEPNIKNGNYDFWSAQHLYQHKDDSQDAKDLVASLVAFASDPANLDTHMSGKAPFWAAQDEMLVTKDNDFAMPAKK